MGERPLPDEVARAARAYLAALVSPSTRADAWHDLLAEVRYWQDDRLVPVLHLAHQVVGQHERVTDEAAVHALVDVGLAEVEDLAVVLGTTVDTVRDLRERVDRAQGSGERESDGSGVPTTQPVTADARAVATEPQGVPDPAPVPVIAPTAPSPTDDATSRSSTHASGPAASPALRIGFDDRDVDHTDSSDDSDDWGDEPPGELLSYRRLIVIAVVVWVVVVVAWLLGG